MSTPVRSTTLTPEGKVEAPASRLQWRHWLAIGLWIGSLWTTTAFVQHYIPLWAIAILVSALVQAGLTVGEHPLWLDRNYYDDDGTVVINDKGKAVKRPIPKFPLLLLLLDAVPNTWGAWFVVRDLHLTPPAIMWREMGLGTVHPITGPKALILCATLGIILAIAPEAIWRGDDV
jgi:hypothetical protein